VTPHADVLLPACFPAAQSQHWDLTPTPCTCPQWQPSRKGYLRFLTESKQVYDTLEGIIAEAPSPECEPQPRRSSFCGPMRHGCLCMPCMSPPVHTAPARAPCADVRFQNTGLERAAALEQDIAWMQQQYDLPAEPVQEDGPGMAYSRRVTLIGQQCAPLAQQGDQHRASPGCCMVVFHRARIRGS
jgi:hypothetical protein